MQGIVSLNIVQFCIVYVLLLIVFAIMKRSKVNQTKLLFVASVCMTVQLVIAGFILTYIFENPHPLFTVLYLITMASFATYRVLSKNKELSREFKLIVAASLILTGFVMIAFFVGGIIGISIFNPQYTIPLAGMIFGNAMTGLNLGLKTFRESLEARRYQMESLLNLGVEPRKILMPFVNNALETALLPSINTMLGMGIVSLPGMMTGQILSGTMPMTAILYQISITIVICAVVCLAVFSALYFGHKTVYNKKNQFIM